MNQRYVPSWVPAEALAEIDLSELATEAPGLREHCARLSARLGANVAVYRRDARGQSGGLCSRYRPISLTPGQVRELTHAEQMFPAVLFVAYERPSEPSNEKAPGASR